jgi:hypothetical protein
MGEFGWGACSCYCYHRKTKSTPRFGLGWEFDKNKYTLDPLNPADIVSQKTPFLREKNLVAVFEKFYLKPF